LHDDFDASEMLLGIARQHEAGFDDIVFYPRASFRMCGENRRKRYEKSQ
jgi:hypothetical protein